MRKTKEVLRLRFELGERYLNPILPAYADRGKLSA